METLTIQQMVNEGIPIFVVNCSHRRLGKPHMLMLEFPNPTGGRKSTVKLPAIKYPINISQRVAPPEAIAMSQDFIDLINQGILKIVSPDEAQRVLKAPDARAAVNKAFNDISKRGIQQRRKNSFNVRSGGSRVTRADPDLDSVDSNSFLNSAPGFATEVLSPKESLKVSAQSGAVDSKIVQLCMDLQDNPDLQQDYLLDFKGMDEDALATEDLHYIMEHCSKFANISAYIRSILAKRAGQSGPTNSTLTTDTMAAQSNDGWGEMDD